MIAVILGSVIVVVVLVLAIIRKKKHGDQKGQIEGEDLNPVYGMYYFSNGAKIDESQSEVVEGNEYYGK